MFNKDESIIFNTFGPVIIPRIINHINFGSFIFWNIVPIDIPPINIKNKLRNILVLFFFNYYYKFLTFIYILLILFDFIIFFINFCGIY